jgi:hypothetical protein
LVKPHFLKKFNKSKNMTQNNLNTNFQNQTQSPKNFIVFYIVITALISGLIAGGGTYLWQSYVAKREIQKLKTQQEQLKATSTGGTILPTSAKTDNKLSEQKNIVQEFLNSSYRVLSVQKNPFAPYSLIITTERSGTQCGTKNKPSRCINDTTCGSIYTSRNCYFFLEPQYVDGANPFTRFIAQWKGDLDALLLDKIKFKDKENVEFQSAGGDGPINVHFVWNLNLKTGDVKEITKQTFGPNAD